MQKTNCNTCTKKEEWSIGFMVFMCSLLSWMFWVGLYHSLKHRLLSGVSFMLLTFVTTLSGMHIVCRHCYYYGKRCYFGLGLIMPYVFAKKDGPPSTAKVFLWLGIFTADVLYPIRILFKKTSGMTFIKKSLFYVIPPALSVVITLLSCCPVCKSTECPLNPEKLENT